MNTIEKQTTIKKEVSLSGIGLHTGATVTITFLPAPANHGYIFQRVDIEGQPKIAAVAENVIDTSRGTTIGNKEFRISTIEHVLAALAGLQIDNALIQLNQEETPILDGSSSMYLKVLQESGIEELDAIREYFVLEDIISYSNAGKKVEMTIIPDESRRISVMINYETQVLGTQNAELNDYQDFKDNIGPCRTFVFLHELEFLLNNNLIKGGDLSNAIVFVNRVVSDDELGRLAGLFNKPTVQVLNQGILNNLELHFDNEPARHKLLDIVGDFALVGMPVKGRIIASRPGHESNVAFALKIREHIRRRKAAPRKYDFTKEPLYDINQIKRLLPHRPPFLLVDKILEMSEDNVVGMKNVTMNESFFVGHFPDEPVMPAVLQIEAMAQTGGVMMLSRYPDPENYLTYFLSIDKVKLRNKVVPGDTLVFELRLLSPMRRGLCHMEGKAYVGEKLVMEAEMLAQIVKKSN